MKIAWASPFNSKSAIGRFSLNVVRELASRGHEVVVIRTESGNAARFPPISTEILSIPHDDPDAAKRIKDADVLASNIGDHYEFHAGILTLDYPVPTVGIFHDWCIINFFYGWAQATGSQSDAKRLMERFHGTSAWHAYTNVPPEHFLMAAATGFPMTGWVAERVDCAVTHSRFYHDLVSQHCAGKVTHLPLAYPAHSNSQSVVAPFKRMDGRFLLYTFGMVNPNKRIEQVIGVIGSDRTLRDSISYVVDGYVTDAYRAHLSALAERLGVELVLNGPVSDDALSQTLLAADAVCCLRFPALEGASASAIEAMQAGCPVLVTDTGFYSEVPSCYVYKIDSQDEADSLSKALNVIVAQTPNERRTFGNAAAAWAMNEFGASKYASGIEEVFTDAIRNQHLPLVSRALARELVGMTISPDDPLVDRAFESAKHIFSLHPRQIQI